MKTLENIVALILAGLFLFAGGEKIVNAIGFSLDLQNFRLVPNWSVYAIVLIFPWWEVLAAVAILIPTWRRAGAIMMVGMGLVFMFAVSWALAHGYNINCGCFGHKEGNAAKGTLLKTLAIDIGVVLGGLFLAYRARFTPTQAPSPLTVQPQPA